MHVNINGKTFIADEAKINYDDRSFRYGDGLFETMKIRNGKILLESFHFERLVRSLNILKFEISELFLSDKFRTEIIQLCERNNCLSMARVRLTISRGNGNLYQFDSPLNYVIEARPLSDEEVSNHGITIGIFPDAKKSCDIFSSLKSSNFLLYVMAAKFALENELDDCLLLNVHDRICDSTISNIFWIKDEVVYTPPLSEGCVDGVMRRWMLQKVQGTRYLPSQTLRQAGKVQEKTQGTSEKVVEKICEVVDLENADEIFLTNAIRGIRPVKKFGDKIYSTEISKQLMVPLQEELT